MIKQYFALHICQASNGSYPSAGSVGSSTSTAMNHLQTLLQTAEGLHKNAKSDPLFAV